MNLASIIGFTMAVVVVWFGVIGPAVNRNIFMDSHALILVLGGTTAAAFIAFPIKKIFGMFRVLLKEVIFKRHSPNVDLVKEIVDASNVAKMDPSSLANRHASHPFLKEGFLLIADGVLSDAELSEVLKKRSLFFKKAYGGDAKMFTALGKFPPAFGLLGASSGMIAMMGNLGGEGGQASIGAAMAIALVATFWGIGLSNLIILPLADYYHKLADDDFYTRLLIMEGLLMLKRRESPLVVVEKMNSFLHLSDRIPSSGAASSGRRAA
jgi:chemotaxis protein MotA